MALYYYNTTGNKISIANKKELFDLAERGIISPETRIGNSRGEMLAKNVLGLKFIAPEYHRAEELFNLENIDFENMPKEEHVHISVPTTKKTHKHKKIFMMHIDYTLVIKETQEIILAIELDDKSHHSKKANINDPKKNEMLKESRVHYARVPVNKMYDPIIINKIVKFCKKKIMES